ncbi:hypothetical protein [Geofilum rubicundum]|nr:hypothetical protein [Geofilum rubicundum]
MESNTNVLYVVPDLKKVSGGPRNRISLLGQVFKHKGDSIIVGEKKLLKAIKSPSVNFTYVESATNRIALIDLLSLSILRLKSKRVFVFIRDVYFDFFPENYRSPKGRLLTLANHITNLFFSWIADCFFFPTNKMGAVFFRRGTYVEKPYYLLPPGVPIGLSRQDMPDFGARPGIVYLGGTGYKNSGFEQFLEFAKLYQKYYDFFVLSGDNSLKEVLSDLPYVVWTQLPLLQIPDFLAQNNIAYAFHSRPRNDYDDLTFPIKVMDFLALGLPFVTEKHLPLVELLGVDYPLFASVADYNNIHQMLSNNYNPERYRLLTNRFLNIANENGYEQRYAYLLSVFLSYNE